MELTCQTRKLSVALGVWSVTGGALRNSRLRNTLFKDLFSCCCEFLGTTTKGLGIEATKMVGKTRYHRWAQCVRHTEHEFIFTSMLDKSP